MYYLKNKADAVQCVSDLLDRLSLDSPLIMTITPDSSGAYSVRTVIGVSSEEIVKTLGQICYDQLTSIS